MPDHRKVHSFADALRHGPIVLDGGLATELERRGNDLSTALWSARLLVDDPREIVEVHRAFFAAGAQVATTASYQASVDGLAAIGVDPAHVLTRSVELAREASERDPRRWVAASIGPYGAALADGSEYRGDYGLSVAELRRFHRPRLQILAAAQPDVFAVETIPCLAEVEAVLAELDGLDTPAWLSITCAGTRTRAGEPAEEAFAMAADSPAVIAMGVNCVSPHDVADLIPLAGRSGKPVVAYPNSGEGWDAVQRAWQGDAEPIAALVPSWLDAGVDALGGCCRVTPEQIVEIASAVARTRTHRVE